jgi:hypothetical protein
MCFQLPYTVGNDTDDDVMKIEEVETKEKKRVQTHSYKLRH